VAITSDNHAHLTSRLAVARLGTIRLGAIESANRLKPLGAEGGQFIWNRDTPNFGNPDDTAASFTTARD
jgi:hypothetical protein